jgi:hypothetical protein
LTSLSDASRPTVMGSTTPGKRTVLRRARRGRLVGTSERLISFSSSAVGRGMLCSKSSSSLAKSGNRKSVISECIVSRQWLYRMTAAGSVHKDARDKHRAIPEILTDWRACSSVEATYARSRWIVVSSSSNLKGLCRIASAICSVSSMEMSPVRRMVGKDGRRVEIARSSWAPFISGIP